MQALFRLTVVLILLASLAAVASGSPTSVDFSCEGRPGTIGSMENEYIQGTGAGACWFHIGHHTYDARGLYKVAAVRGSVFSVEVEASPPTDLDPPNAALAFEASVDGLSWTVLKTIPFDLTRDRQQIDFTFDAGGAVARYFRIRQPRSAAQGLAGFLDRSSFTATLERVVPPGPVAQPKERAYVCAAHVMERFFESHPCWFGGVNRYDSPSVFHTYPIGPSALERVTGRATFAPWRSDDYYYDGGSATEITGHLEISSDGVAWTRLTSFIARFGLPVTFDAQGLEGQQASYVRLAGEYMKQPRRHPALKHARGMLIDSQIQITAR